MMDQFNEEHSKILLAKEWLVKIDAQTSTPYLIVRLIRHTFPSIFSFKSCLACLPYLLLRPWRAHFATVVIGQKFHSSTVDLACCILITDTKRTWAEALSSKQFARRWRQCNKGDESPSLDEDDEEAWRTRHLDLLSKAHTLGGMPELSFEVVESSFGDFAFELECDAFKWRWETIFVGHKTSADILSKHLIMPLISVNHLAFSSSELVGDLPPSDLEKAIDKVARTARRTVDTHVKNALSKPRLATTIRRITAVFNFISDPRGIMTEADTPVLLAPREPTPKITKSHDRLESTRALVPEPNDRRDAPAVSKGPSPALSLSRGQSPVSKIADSGSATESEGEEQPSIPASRAVGAGSSAVGVDQPLDIRMRSPTPSGKASLSPQPGGASARNRSITKAVPAPSDTDSSPVRPIKKPKPRAPSSDEDSEEERKRVAAQIKSGSAPARGGLRQPIKRGGKRF